MISGSEKADARPVMTLFQPQPRGLPSISQSKIGLPRAAARCRASHRLAIQGITVHLSSPARGFMSGPGGRCDERVITVARSAGYRTVSTSRIQANTSTTDLFALARVAMLRDVPLPAFAAICAGTPLSRMRAQDAIRQAAKQVLGNSLYDRVRATLLR